MSEDPEPSGFSSTVELSAVVSETEQLKSSFFDNDTLMGVKKAFLETYSDVYCELYGNRVVYFGKKEDQELFLQIKEFRQKNSDKNIDDAMEQFGENPVGDALVNIVFSNPSIDYVIKFTDEPKYHQLRLAWLRKVLKEGVFFEQEAALEPKEIFVKIVVPFEIIAKQAEERDVNFPLLDHKKELYATPPTTMGKILDFFNPEDKVEPEASAPFKRDKLDQFDGGLDQLNPCKGTEPRWKILRYFFRRGVRNLMTYDLLSHILLQPEEIRQIVETHNHDHPKGSLHISEKSSLGLLQMLSFGAFTKFFPTHDGSHKSHQEHPNMRTILKKEWALAFFKKQPLDKIREYFGEKIALYFAFLGFYTVWLWSASIVGFFVFIFGVAYAASLENVTDVERASRLFDNALTIPWAVFVSIWATLYLEFWKRKNAYLAWWWDVLDYEREEVARPEWYGTKMRKNPITGKMEHHYPQKVRYAKMATSSLCIGIAVAFLLVLIFLYVVYQVWSRNYFGKCQFKVDDIVTTCASDPTNSACTDPCWSLNQTYCPSQLLISLTSGNYSLCSWNSASGICAPDCPNYDKQVPCQYTPLPGQVSTDYRVTCAWVDVTYASTITSALINLCVIMVMNIIFQKVAGILNDWENHKTQTEYEDALIIKTFFFQFLNSFSSLFYIAFFKGTVAQSILGDDSLRDVCTYGSCFTELLVQLAIIFVGKQLISQIVEVGIPYMKELWNRKLAEKKHAEIEKRYSILREQAVRDGTHSSEETKDVPQWVKDDGLASYGAGLFDEYNEMILQFGFITLFVASFPLGPLFALLNNLVEIRTDAYKLLTSFQRPPAVRAQDMGSWEIVLQALGMMAVITNAFIVAFTSAWVSDRIEYFYSQNNDPNPTAAEIMAGRLFIVIIFEHAVFGLKLLCAWLVPDVPGPVQVAIDRERYIAKLAIEGVNDTAQLGRKLEEEGD